jgi:hypothetical protein
MYLHYKGWNTKYLANTSKGHILVCLTWWLLFFLIFCLWFCQPFLL